MKIKLIWLIIFIMLFSYHSFAADAPPVISTGGSFNHGIKSQIPYFNSTGDMTYDTTNGFNYSSGNQTLSVPFVTTTIQNSTLASPVISGTVTGGANYTGPTITNPNFAGTSSGNITGNNFTLPSPVISGTVTGSANYTGATLTNPISSNGSFSNPSITGTVTGSANYTAPTITNPAFSGTSTGAITISNLTSPSLTSTGTFTTNDIITKGPWVDVRAGFGTIDNTGVSDSSVAINAAIASALLGQKVVIPCGTYLINSPILISKSIHFTSEGSNTVTTSDGTNTKTCVTIKYSGSVQAMSITQSGSVALNGVIIEGIEFIPTVAGASADGIVLNPNSNAITGVKFLNVKVRDFGKSQVKSVTPGDVWNITFEGGSYVNNTASTTHVLDFTNAGAGGFSIRLMQDIYIQSRATGFYGLYTSANCLAIGGIIEAAGTTPGNGINCGSGSKIEGTHIENTGAVGSTIGILVRGDHQFINPANLSGFNTGVQLVTTTNSIIFNNATASGLRDVYSQEGLGSYAGTVVFLGAGSFDNKRLTVDGVDEITIFTSTNYRFPKQALFTVATGTPAFNTTSMTASSMNVTLWNGYSATSGTCATNYTRDGLNCTVTTTSATTIIIGTTCTAITLGTSWNIPATARIVRIPIDVQISSGTVSGAEQTTIQFYSDSGCTTVLNGGDTFTNTPYFGVYSSLTSAGTLVGRNDYILNIRNNTATTIYAKKTDVLTTGVTSTWTVWQPSYYYEN